MGKTEESRPFPPSQTGEPSTRLLPQVRRAQLAEVQKILHYSFTRPQWLNRALTHRSFSNSPSGHQLDYERLEFLGDSVLGFVISDLLFQRFPEFAEGELSKLRSSLVSRRQLARLSKQLGLDQYVLLSRGEEQTGGRRKPAIQADLFESLLAAIYLDGGIEPVRRFVARQFEPLLAEVAERGMSSQDYKSRLQELLHARGLREPDYQIVREKGPDHRKQFLVEAWIDNQPQARAWGRSKKQAEQRVAHEVLSQLDPTMVEGSGSD